MGDTIHWPCSCVSAGANLRLQLQSASDKTSKGSSKVTVLLEQNSFVWMNQCFLAELWDSNTQREFHAKKTHFGKYPLVFIKFNLWKPRISSRWVSFLTHIKTQTELMKMNFISHQKTALRNDLLGKEGSQHAVTGSTVTTASYLLVIWKTI